MILEQPRGRKRLGVARWCNKKPQKSGCRYLAQERVTYGIVEAKDTLDRPARRLLYIYDQPHESPRCGWRRQPGAPGCCNVPGCAPGFCLGRALAGQQGCFRIEREHARSAAVQGWTGQRRGQLKDLLSSMSPGS